MRTDFGIKTAMPSADHRSPRACPHWSLHEGVKPLDIAHRLDPDRHRRRPRAVELLNDAAGVGEFPLNEFAGAGVENGDLLLSRVQITSDECHDHGGLLFLRAAALGLSEVSSSARPFS